MKTLFLGGFGIPAHLCSERIHGFEGIEVIDNASFTYQEAERALLERTDTEGAVIAGWSLGSLFALRWTIEHPERGRGLFLTGATAKFCEKPGYANTIPGKSLFSLMSLLQKNARQSMSRFYASILEQAPDRDNLSAALLDALPESGILLQGLSELRDTDLLDRLHEIKVPVLIAAGDQDRTTPYAGVERIKAKIGPARIIPYKGGHSLLFERPELFLSLLKDFLCTIGK